MCTMTKEGFIMEDDVLLKHESDIDEIPKKYIDSLANAQATQWDSFVVMHNIKKLEANLKQKFEEHDVKCPAKLPRKFFKTTSGYAKDLSYIIVAITSLVGFLKAFNII